VVSVSNFVTPRHTRVSAEPPAYVPAVRLAVVLWGGLALVDLTRGAPSYAGLGALVLLVIACSVGMARTTAAAAGLIAWLVATGFVVNHDGTLRYDGPADLARLALLVGMAVLASGVRR
jgi:hypothetical protein